MPHAWTAINRFGGLAAAAFTWSNGTATNRGYLNDGQMDRRFSISGSPATVVIDAGAADTLNAVAVLNSNLATLTGATIRVRGADDAGITTNIVTKAASAVQTAAPRQKDHVLTFPATARRYWEVQFSWSGLGVLLLGELYGAHLTVLSRGVVYGHGETETYAVAAMEMDAGGVRTNFLAGPYRTKRLPFADLSEAQRNEVAAMWRAGRGGATPVLWVHDFPLAPAFIAAPPSEQDVILGKVRTEFGWGESDFSLYDVDALELRSLGREVGA